VVVLPEELATHKLVLVNVRPDFLEMPVPTPTTANHPLPVLLHLPALPPADQNNAQFVLTRTNNAVVALVVLATLPLVPANARLAALELLAVLLMVT